MRAADDDVHAAPRMGCGSPVPLALHTSGMQLAPWCTCRMQLLGPHTASLGSDMADGSGGLRNKYIDGMSIDSFRASVAVCNESRHNFDNMPAKSLDSMDARITIHPTSASGQDDYYGAAQYPVGFYSLLWHRRCSCSATLKIQLQCAAMVAANCSAAPRRLSSIQSWRLLRSTPHISTNLHSDTHHLRDNLVSERMARQERSAAAIEGRREGSCTTVGAPPFS